MVLDGRGVTLIPDTWLTGARVPGYYVSMTGHKSRVARDRGGWYYAKCSCGYEGEREEHHIVAQDFRIAHLQEVGAWLV